MKSLFDQPTRAEIITRIGSLPEDSVALWGKMTLYQMLAHCILWEEMLLGKKEYRQSLLGRLFGKMALKAMLKDEPIKPNLPTVPSFRTGGSGDVAAAKANWIALLGEHASRVPSGFHHPFFGQLTAEQAGRIAYKHTDHHLRQFNG
ncbi:MAG: hypothetical protein JWP27_1024 [Flaviaesturariibacter sp.]|nr:hypothetical protein [Flaviaesturariibacter sp.]